MVSLKSKKSKKNATYVITDNVIIWANSANTKSFASFDNYIPTT